jgi:hypothetical protein
MIDQVYRLFDALGVLASSYGWPLTPSIQLPVIFVLATAARDSKMPHHDMYLLVRDYLKLDDWSQLRRIVEEMREYSVVTPRRFKILRDCLDSMSRHGVHGHNAANLVIPTLFTLIDGTLTDFAREVGIKRWSSQRNKTLFRSEFERVTYRFDRSALDLLFDVLFAKSEPGKELNGRKLNRHKILHGEWLDYGRIEHVLRAILIVDFIGYVVEEYRQRTVAGNWETPVTFKSQKSKMLSENLAVSAVPIAQNRLAERVLILPAMPVIGSQRLQLSGGKETF